MEYHVAIYWGLWKIRLSKSNFVCYILVNCMEYHVDIYVGGLVGRNQLDFKLRRSTPGMRMCVPGKTVLRAR